MGRHAGLVVALVLASWAGAARAADMNGSLSIVAHDPRTDEFAVAALSHAPACGNLVPWVEAGVGAIALGGEVNGSWGPLGLKMLRDGVPVQHMSDSLMSSDSGLQRRQIGAVDKTGWPGGYSGSEMVNWSGGVLDSNMAVQGCNLMNHVALYSLRDTLQALRDQPLADRLLAGLEYSQATRADWRGARSAVLVIGRVNPDRPEDASRYVYLRVDDDPNPVGRLQRLYRAWRASHLVGAHLDYAAMYRKAGQLARAEAEEQAAHTAVKLALADTSLGGPALNAMAWQLAQRGAMLDEAWTAITSARAREPKSTEFSDTAAEVRYRQGRLMDALALAEEGHNRVPPDEYLRSRVARFQKLAGVVPPKPPPVIHPGGRR